MFSKEFIKWPRMGLQWNLLFVNYFNFFHSYFFLLNFNLIIENNMYLRNSKYYNTWIIFLLYVCQEKIKLVFFDKYFFEKSFLTNNNNDLTWGKNNWNYYFLYTDVWISLLYLFTRSSCAMSLWNLIQKL